MRGEGLTNAADFGEIKCGEIVFSGFCAADEFDGAIGFDEEFGAAEFSVVLEAHGMSVGTGIMNREQITELDFGERSLDGEFVVIFAKGSDDVDDLVVWFVFTSEHCDVVVGAVHAWSHEICHTGIDTDIVAIDVFVMDGGGNEEAVWSCDHASVFHEDSHGVEWSSGDHGFVEFADTLADVVEVDGLLFGAVGDADTATEVYEFDADAELCMEAECEVEQHASGFGEEAAVEFVGGDHGVEAEAFDAGIAKQLIAFEELLFGEAVFGFFGAADDDIAFAG